MTAKAKVKPFKPVPVAVQLQQKRQAIRKLRQSKPVPVGVQRRQHARAVAKAQQSLPALPGGGPGKAILRKRAQKHGAPLSPDDVACCAAEALAMSLRLAGHQVTEQDVLDLYWLTADDPDEGATIEDTLEAAAASGWPQGTGLILSAVLPQGLHAVLEHDGIWWSWGQPWLP